MRSKLIAAFIVCLLLIVTPLIVKYLENSLSSGLSIGSVVTTSTKAPPTSKQVTYLGCGESHKGADYLIVCPSLIHFSKLGVKVRINITVKFRHPQPCPHSSWKIILENINKCKVVSESRTTLINSYTASKYYIIELLGNGSVDVVYKYGEGCPYGTEEVVRVHFYLINPPSNSQEELFLKYLISEPASLPCSMVISDGIKRAAPRLGSGQTCYNA